jgi:AraC-like DNA-binding protein
MLRVATEPQLTFADSLPDRGAMSAAAHLTPMPMPTTMLHSAPPTPNASVPGVSEVRIGPLRPVAALLREHGVNPMQVLAACGLPPMAFDDPNRRIPFRAAAYLLQRGGWAARRADFGLRVGERLDFADLGLLGRLVQRAPTVGGALDCLVRFFHLQDRGSVAYLGRPDAQLAALGYSILDADVPGIGMAYDTVIAMAMTTLRGLCGPAFQAVEVQLAHAAPADKAPYRRFFAAPVVFDAPHCEIRFDARWLQARNTGADAIVHAVARRAARVAAAGIDRSLTEAVCGIVRALVLSESLSGPGVAAALGLHERTLRRRLQAEGSGLTELIAEARYGVARQLLRETQLSLQDIADALGYAEASVFVRAFRGWAGITPGQWRRRSAAGLGRPAAP